MNDLSIDYEKYKENQVSSPKGKTVLDCYLFISHNGKWS